VIKCETFYKKFKNVRELCEKDPQAKAKIEAYLDKIMKELEANQNPEGGS
jgi:ABC-type Zn uptake system ZnuABC Zn-binding protein ZnuA